MITGETACSELSMKNKCSTENLKATGGFLAKISSDFKTKINSDRCAGKVSMHKTQFHIEPCYLRAKWKML